MIIELAESLSFCYSIRSDIVSVFYWYEIQTIARSPVLQKFTFQATIKSFLNFRHLSDSEGNCSEGQIFYTFD